MVRERRARRPQPEPKDTSILDTPRLKKILSQPIGTPIELTRDEAMAVIDAMLARPDRTNTEEYRRTVREMRAIRRESGALLVRPDRND